MPCRDRQVLIFAGLISVVEGLEGSSLCRQPSCDGLAACLRPDLWESVFRMSGLGFEGACCYRLPSAAAGLLYTFVRVSPGSPTVHWGLAACGPAERLLHVTIQHHVDWLPLQMSAAGRTSWDSTLLRKRALGFRV